MFKFLVILLIKYNSSIKQHTKMINFNYVTWVNTKKQSILSILFIDFWWSIKNSDNWWMEIKKNQCIITCLFNQPDIDKIYSYAKDHNEAKYQLLVNKRKSVAWKHFYGPKALTEYSNDIVNIYSNNDN